MPQSDAAFIIGKTHKVCQDYALVGNDNGTFASIWLSDGCSSSPHTDIGARLLTHNALTRVCEFATVSQAEEESQPRLLDELIYTSLTAVGKIARDMGVPADCLNATLLGLVNSVNRKGERLLYTILYGDGALVYGLTNGEQVVFRSTYPANFPYYPAYLVDTKRRSIWERVRDNRHTITRTILDADGHVRESETFCPEDNYHLIIRPVAGLRWAAILSDGIESFQKRGDEASSCSFTPVNYLEVICHLTAFKNFAGEFVHRRLQSFAKDCNRRGWQHNDDVSIAALYFGEEN